MQRCSLYNPATFTIWYSGLFIAFRYDGTMELTLVYITIYTYSLDNEIYIIMHSETGTGSFTEINEFCLNFLP